MDSKINEIFNEIENTDVRKRITEIKEEINDNDITKKLLKRFNESKVLYEKYGYSDEYIKAKIDLMKEPIIKEYLTIQNEINYISLYINQKINEIIKNTF